MRDARLPPRLVRKAQDRILRPCARLFQRYIPRKLFFRVGGQLAKAAPVRLERCDRSEAPASIVQQLADRVPVIGAQVCETLLRPEAQHGTEHLILIGFARAQITKPAGQLETDGIQKHGARSFIRQKRIRPLHLPAVRAHERFVKYRALHDRHIRRDHVEAPVERIHLVQHLRTLAGKRNHNQDILPKRIDHLVQPMHPKPAEAVSPHKFIACKYCGGLNPQPLKLPKYLIRAVSHAV